MASGLPEKSPATGEVDRAPEDRPADAEGTPPHPAAGPVTNFFVDSATQGPAYRRPRIPGRKSDIHRQIDALLATLPWGVAYGQKVEGVEELGRVLGRSIAAYVSEAIKAEFRSRPNESYADKLDSARWISGELRRFDLAIHSARVGGVATLSADKDGLGGGGRFKLKAKAKPDAGRPSNFNTPRVSELLADIELIEAPRRREGLQKPRAKGDRKAARD